MEGKQELIGEEGEEGEKERRRSIGGGRRCSVLRADSCFQAGGQCTHKPNQMKEVEEVEVEVVEVEEWRWRRKRCSWTK